MPSPINKQELLKLIGPNIIDVSQVPIIKEAILYQLFADKLHIFVLGDAGACAKSSYAPSIRALCPRFAHIQASSNPSGPGVRDAMLKLRTGWGTAVFDEVPRMPAKSKGMLFEILQMQSVTINLAESHGGSQTFQLNANIYATANPKGEKWRSYGDIQSMKVQMPLPIPLLRRFHIPICTRDYTPEEFHDIQIKYYQIEEKFEDYLNEHLDEYEDAQERITQARKIKVNITHLPDFADTFLTRLKKFENDLVFPVSGEVFETFKNLVRSRTRWDLCDTPSDKHWQEAINFYTSIIQTWGLTKEMIVRKFTRP
jgi:hypothetical protein